MPHRNRVTPFGTFEATAARGLLMGNRGILHDERGVIGSARWRHKSWIACALSFKGRKAAINPPGHYTQLFFCDEATAFAAGHRPCAECRRPHYERYMSAWRRAYGLEKRPRAGEVDNALHQARVRQERQAGTRLGDLPDGAFIAPSDQPTEAWLIWGGRLHRWSHEGYRERRSAVADDEVMVLTPEPTLRVLAAGYVPEVHPSIHVGRDWR